MINLDIPRSTTVALPRPRRWQMGRLTFWSLLAVQMLIFLAIVFQIVQSMPRTMPISQSDSVEYVRAAILSAGAHDPLIELSSGVEARASNLRGIQYQGQIYYYYYEGQPNYDPLSRGTMTRDQVEVLFRDVGDVYPLVIYRVTG